MSMTRWLVYPLGAAMLVGAACAILPDTMPAATGDRDVDIRTAPIPFDEEDAARTRTGRLLWRGGIELSADDARFGGLSGLRWRTDREGFLAITDQGHWVSLTPRESGVTLTGIAAARIGALAGLDGTPLGTDKALADTEGVEVVGDTAFVTFERSHRIWSYDLGATGWPGGAASEVVNAPTAWFAGQADNGGAEAIAWTGDRMLLISEDGRTEDGNADGIRFALSHGPGQPEGFAIAPPFKPTDAVAIGDSLLILARSYSPLQGVAARLYESRGGKEVLLAELRPPLSVDNMEGIAVRRQRGRTFIYIVSDDNFSPLQRTLLMKFELVE
ncbi:esterase-like activity of phytase family protein [Pacificimonas sp. WHA3]|uniref:Esterase-like activity of phytase family protein n=1 Tax=Pacificimonas pallii TaxID=2827236 RepID=A0ABS6SBF7_9SPHN|nr:esterase-like activity of phytase family protein [Pacificimonas pallii]MBV7255266.1 esterase-like activity of phytase family protein [Pacificimonas pallii]